MKSLIRESEWIRVFKIQNENSYLYESKFLVDDLHVSYLAISNRWPSLSVDERIDFASAFSCQPPRDNEDQQILDFLLDVGSVEVWRAVAKLLPFHPRADRALAFLLEKARYAPGQRANYYQALELLHKPEAIPILRQQYEEYRKLLAGEPTEGKLVDVWTDYLQCSKALWTLTQDPTYLAAIKEALTTAPPELRSSVILLLSQSEKG